MGKLIAIVGNCGSGKTTLAHLLGPRLGYSLLLEGHEERPFQGAFMHDHNRLGLQNQVDYLLLRAEQEQTLRNRAEPGIVDGGLDQDFHIFSRLFHYRGYLSDQEFQLCERLYRFLRQALPPPNLTIRLVAPLPVLQQRLTQRKRPLDIVSLRDLPEIERLLAEWNPTAIEVDSTGGAFSGRAFESLLTTLKDAVSFLD